jgi:hypothetical protein
LERKVPLNEGNFFDFCTLVNAVPLHERLLTLRSQIPEELKESRLYEYLKRERILNELNVDYRNFDEVDKNEITRLFGGKFMERDLELVLGSSDE